MIKNRMTYSFKVKKYTLDGILGMQLQKLLIYFTNPDRPGKLDFYLSLDLDFKEDLFIEKLEIFNLDDTYEGISMDCPKNMGILMGYFAFASDDATLAAIEDLLESLNNKSEIERTLAFQGVLSVEWSMFAIEFTTWFNNKLRPCMKRAIELHKLYFQNEKI